MTVTPCTFPGCGRKQHCRGLCGTHYTYQRLGRELRPIATPIFEARHFWDLLDRSGECWIWTRGKNEWGYGVVCVDGKMRTTHRHAWTMANGPIPPGMCVCHRCDNPPCCRPDHLWLGTQSENTYDMVAKGRHYPVGKLTGHRKRRLRAVTNVFKNGSGWAARVGCFGRVNLGTWRDRELAQLVQDEAVRMAMDPIRARTLGRLRPPGRWGWQA